MPEDMKAGELLPLVTEVVAAKLSNGKTLSSELAALIQSVYQVLHELRINGTPAELPAPAVPIKKSVTPNYIVCLEDGRQLQMLKGHLRKAFDMTPEQYRRRWGPSLFLFCIRCSGFSNAGACFPGGWPGCSRVCRALPRWAARGW